MPIALFLQEKIARREEQRVKGPYFASDQQET